MNKRSIQIVAGLLVLPALARADNHKWEIREIFSSADEQVQFVELFDTEKDEHNLTGVSLTSASGGFFVFPSNLPSSATENRHVLLATAAFAAIPGAPTPDYVIPAGFLDRLADTVTYTATPHAVSFTALPSDGFRSINAAGIPGTNSPTNFAGQTGSIVLATASVRNGSGVNVVCYQSSPPALGKLWTATVDTRHHPRASNAVILGHLLPSTGPMLPYGEILLNGASPYIFHLVKPSPGVAQFSAMIPLDLLLLGSSLSTQAVITGGRLEFCNAVDMKVAW